MIASATLACVQCNAPLRPGARFCGGCGAPTEPTTPAPPAPSATSPIGPTIWFYVAFLGVAGVLNVYARITDDEFGALLIGAIGLAVVTLAFGWSRGALIAAPSRTAGLSLAGYGLILLASVPIVLVVAAYVDGLYALFRIHVPNELGVLEHRHVVWAVVLIVIAPPLTEELAFRGLIYGGLRDHLRGNEALLISAIAFGLIHLSIPSLVTHVPLGLYLGWLRQRTGSLWPGVFAHACHNLGVCLLEWA